MAKLTIIATGRVTEAGQAELPQRLLEAQTKALQEPGTETYKMHISNSDPRAFAVYEVYTDDAAYQAHKTGKAIGELFAWMKPVLETVDVKEYRFIE